MAILHCACSFAVCGAALMTCTDTIRVFVNSAGITCVTSQTTVELRGWNFLGWKSMVTSLVEGHICAGGVEAEKSVRAAFDAGRHVGSAARFAQEAHAGTAAALLGAPTSAPDAPDTVAEVGAAAGVAAPGAVPARPVGMTSLFFA